MISKLVGLAIGTCSSVAIDKILTNAMPEVMDGMTRILCKVGVFGVSSAVGSIVADHFESECNDVLESIEEFKNAKKLVEESENDDEQSV